MTGFRFVDEHQAEYRVVDLCRVAKVSRSGFYAWKSRRPSPQAVANAELLDQICEADGLPGPALEEHVVRNDHRPAPSPARPAPPGAG